MRADIRVVAGFDASLEPPYLVDVVVPSSGAVATQVQWDAVANPSPPLRFAGYGPGLVYISVNVSSVTVMTDQLMHSRYQGLRVIKSIRQRTVGSDVRVPVCARIFAPA